MRILVLCYEYPPIGGGGGRVAKNVAESLVKRGHQVRVQTAGMRHLPDFEIVNGVEVCRTHAFRRREDTSTVPEMALFIMTSFWPTIWHLFKWKPEVIHAHFAMPTGVLAWLAHLFSRVPYVITAHLGDVPGGVQEQTDQLFKIAKPLSALIWKNAAAVTAVSEFVKQLAERAYQRPVTKIVNGIQLDHAATNSSVRKTRQIVFIGRFNPQKFPQFAVDAVAGLRGDNWKLTMIGDGPLMGEVREKIAMLKLENHIELTGWLAAGEIEKILRVSDLMLMPSLSEGLPMAAVEALKFGVAIMGSDIPGLRDVIDGGINGCALPLEQNIWTQRIESLLENDSILFQMKIASREKSREFDLDKIALEYERVLASVL